MYVEEQPQKEDKLERRLDENIPQHREADESGIALVGPAVEQRHGGRLRAQRQGAHGVHDKVYPKHHERVQWRVHAGECADEHDKKRNNCCNFRGVRGRTIQKQQKWRNGKMCGVQG